jgi:hypothetical protein
LDISKRKEKRHGKKRLQYYEIRINNIEYFEIFKKYEMEEFNLRETEFKDDKEYERQLIKIMENKIERLKSELKTKKENFTFNFEKNKNIKKWNN